MQDCRRLQLEKPLHRPLVQLGESVKFDCIDASFAGFALGHVRLWLAKSPRNLILAQVCREARFTQSFEEPAVRCCVQRVHRQLGGENCAELVCYNDLSYNGISYGPGSRSWTGCPPRARSRSLAQECHKVLICDEFHIIFTPPLAPLLLRTVCGIPEGLGGVAVTSSSESSLFEPAPPLAVKQIPIKELDVSAAEAELRLRVAEVDRDIAKLDEAQMVDQRVLELVVSV